MPATRAPRSNASPRAIAVYLLGLRPGLADAIAARRGLIRGIGRLLAAANDGHTLGVALTAGRVGGEYLPLFRNARRGLDDAAVPAPCAACHRALVGWLDSQVAACEVLVAARASGDLTRLRETQWRLAEGRDHGRRFNAEYARLVADLRQRVAVARSRSRRRARQSPRRALPARAA